MPIHGRRVLEIAMSPSVIDTAAKPSDLTVTCLLRPSTASKLPHDTGGWTCVADFRKDLPFRDHSFDLVHMHRTLDLLVDNRACQTSQRALSELALQIRRVLAPGGVFTGSVANRTSWSRWRYKKRTAGPQWAPATFSIRSCRTFLARSGFENIEIFNVLPTADSPIRLINTDRHLSRIGFRRELEATRASMTWPSYLPRRVLVELSLNRFLEESIFFWAYRA
jgi:SAM-dependent methyltransferase